MTSWISNSLPKKKIAPLPTSMFLYNQGSFADKPQDVTFVTALYELTFDKVQAITKIPHNLVVFTQSSLADAILSARKENEDRTRVVVLEKDQWVAVKKYIPNLWTQQVKQDPEIRLGRTMEDLHFLFEKKEFLVKAVTLNPFDSLDFVWLDPTILDSSLEIPETLQTNRIPTDRLLVWNPEPFTADDLASSFFRGKRRVENSVIAGSKQAWIEYAKLYEVVMTMKLKISQFIGDDSLMLHCCVTHKPDLFCLVKEGPILPYLH